MSRTAGLPSAYLVHLVELARRFGVEDDELLEPLGLETEDLSDATRRIEVSQVIALIERARTLTGEPGLGIYLGLAMRASWHGYLGFAVLTAKDVGDALRLGERFLPTRTTSFGFKLTVEGGVASFVIDERDDFGSARDVVVLALLIGLSTIGQALSGKELDGRIEVALPKPPWLERFAANARLDRLSFDRPAHRIVFDAAQLSTPFHQSRRHRQEAGCRAVREGIGRARVLGTAVCAGAGVVVEGRGRRRCGRRGTAVVDERSYAQA